MERKLKKMRAFFESGRTLSSGGRKKALMRLRKAILFHEQEIYEALYKDLDKSRTEAYMTEIGMTLSELEYTLKHMERWMAKKPVPTPLAQFAASSFTVKEPKGVVLIMAPWNYPFQLCIEPLIGALAAGNCCVVKPSEYAPATSALLHKMLSECFPEQYVLVMEGGMEVNQALLEQKFDHIFFTGSAAVGKIVMERAAKHLTPVTLELGGKSPCIIDSTANPDLAAKRIVFGKLLNSGQTCVAPDYMLVDRTVKKEFTECLKKWCVKMYGEHPLENGDYGKIINEKHMKRLEALISPEKVIFGGKWDEEKRKMEPTILDEVTAEDAVMQEEIFGPIFPIIPYDSIREAVRFIKKRPKPLSLYLFTEDRRLERHILRHVSFGGGCINDTIIHLANSRMGFGGVGQSGMGSYHGKQSFDTFSHEKSIVKKYTCIDLPIRYAPYTEGKSRLIRLFLK